MRDKERTINQVVAVLVRYGERCGYRIEPERLKRRLRDWKEKGLLPPLQQRGRGRRRGKEFYWTQRAIVRQALLLYEVLDWHRNIAEVRPLLWLLGFAIPPEELRSALLWRVDTFREALLQGADAADEDSVKDRVEDLAYPFARSRRSRHDAPTAGAAARLSLSAKETLGSILYGIQVDVSGPDLLERLSDLLLAFPSPRFTVGAASHQESDADHAVGTAPPLAEESLLEIDMVPRAVAQGMTFIQRYFASIAQRRAAIASATEEELNQARDDLSALMCGTYAVVMADHGSFSTAEERYFAYNVLYILAVRGTSALILLRRDGYGALITEFAQFCEQLRHPAAQAAIRTIMPNPDPVAFQALVATSFPGLQASVQGWFDRFLKQLTNSGG
jgi:hypothetical protein